MATTEEIRRQVERLRGMMESPERASAEAWLADQGEAAVPLLVAEIETRNPFGWRRAMAVLSRNLTPTALNALLTVQAGLDIDVAEAKQTCLAAYRTNLMAALNPDRLPAVLHLAPRLSHEACAALIDAVWLMAASHPEAVPAAREAVRDRVARWELAGWFHDLDAELAVALAGLAVRPQRADLDALIRVVAAALRLPRAAVQAARALESLASLAPCPELRQALKPLRGIPFWSRPSAFLSAYHAIEAATVAWKDLPLPASGPSHAADLPVLAEEP